MPASMTFNRRRLLLAGSSLLAGCTVPSPQEGLFGPVGRFNDRAQEMLFGARRLARDPGANAVTPAGAFPAYKLGKAFPTPPSSWALEVGGLVDRPGRLSLEELRRMP